MKISSVEWKQASRNLLRNKRRSVVTGLAIMAGFCGLTLFGGYVARVERYCMVNTVYMNHMGHIQVHKTEGIDKYFSKPARYLIDPETLQALVDILSEKKEVEFFSPYLVSNGLIQYESDSFAFQGKAITKEADRFAREHNMVQKWNAELRSSVDGAHLSDSQEQNPVMVTYKLANFLKNMRNVNLQGLTVDNGFNALDATITTRYTTGFELTEDTSIITTLPVFQELMATDGVTYMGVYLKNDMKARSFSQELNSIFTQNKIALEAVPFFDERIGLFYTGSMNFLYAITGFFFLLVSTVVILSVANAISMNIMERVKELGTMRAIGFTPQDLARLVGIESFILAIMSVSTGFLVSQLIALAVNLSNIRFSPPGIAGEMQFVLTPWPSLCLIFAVPLILFATVTAYLVTKRKIQGEVSKLLTETST
ncbi:MAG: FtsX-like permease family protein [Bdellovibrionota bacterium]